MEWGALLVALSAFASLMVSPMLADAFALVSLAVSTVVVGSKAVPKVVAKPAASVFRLPEKVWAAGAISVAGWLAGATVGVTVGTTACGSTASVASAWFSFAWAALGCASSTPAFFRLPETV